MLTHQDIWSALDRLAEKFSMSPSAMARLAGLDPTTFNKSKRRTLDGKARWPSTESLSKVINALGISFSELAIFVDQSGANRFSIGLGANVPLVNMAEAGKGGYFDDRGFPTGMDWDEIRMPGITDTHVFALRISGDTMAPIIKQGDILVISPNANIRRGDRVVAMTRSGEVVARGLKSMSADKAVLSALNPQHPDRTIALNDIQWMARIVWISQ